MAYSEDSAVSFTAPFYVGCLFPHDDDQKELETKQRIAQAQFYSSTHPNPTTNTSPSQSHSHPDSLTAQSDYHSTLLYETIEYQFLDRRLLIRQFDDHPTNANALWPEATFLAEFLTSTNTFAPADNPTAPPSLATLHSLLPPTARVLELGSATGALAIYLRLHSLHITTSDLPDPLVTANIQHNCQLNNTLHEHFEHRWGDVAGLRDELVRRGGGGWDVVLGSDLLAYESSYEGLSDTVSELLPAGEAAGGRVMWMCWKRREQKAAACFDIDTQVLVRINWPDGQPSVRWMSAVGLRLAWLDPELQPLLEIASLRTDAKSEEQERQRLLLAASTAEDDTERTRLQNAAGRVAGSLDRLVYARLSNVVAPFVYDNNPEYADQHPVRIRVQTYAHGALDLLVTPDHDMWAAPQRERQQKIAGLGGKQTMVRLYTTFPYQTVRAAQLTVSPLLDRQLVPDERRLDDSRRVQQFLGWRIKQSAPINTEEDYSFTLPSMEQLIEIALRENIDLTDHVPAIHLRNAAAYPAHTFTGDDMDTFLAFLGMYISDGSINTTRRGSSINCHLAFGQKQHTKFIEKVWDRLAAIRRADDDDRQAVGGNEGDDGGRTISTTQTKFHWTVPQLVVWLLVTGVHTSHQADYQPLPWWVWSLTPRQLGILFIGLFHGDGSHNNQAFDCDWCGFNHYHWDEITTVSEKHAHELQALAMHAGWYSTVVLRRGDHLINNLTGNQHVDTYHVTMHARSNPSLCTGSERYGSNVYVRDDTRPETRQRLFWCVTTEAPSHVVLIRRRVNDFDDDFPNTLARPDMACEGHEVGTQWITAWVGNCKSKGKDRENGWFHIMRRKGFECTQMGKGMWRIQRQRHNKPEPPTHE